MRQGIPVGYGIGRRSADGGDPGRLDRLADMVENLLNGSGFGDEGDDVCGIRYRVDCRRSCSQGQRPFRVADCPFADS